jgi:hypothetical protein
MKTVGSKQNAESRKQRANACSLLTAYCFHPSSFILHPLLSEELIQMNTQAIRYAGRAAIVTGVASIVGFIALMLFFRSRRRKPR